MRGTAPRRERLVLRAHALDLHGLDTLPARDLLVFVDPDARPLQGLGGLLDWRLCGALTRILERGIFEGRDREQLLTVASGRVPAERIFLYGTGGRDLRSLLAPALEMVARAGGREVAVAPFSEDEASYVEVADQVARAAHAAGLEALVCLGEKVGAVTKALVVVEAHHPWAVLEALL